MKLPNSSSSVTSNWIADGLVNNGIQVHVQLLRGSVLVGRGDKRCAHSATELVSRIDYMSSSFATPDDLTGNACCPQV